MCIVSNIDNYLLSVANPTLVETLGIDVQPLNLSSSATIQHTELPNKEKMHTIGFAPGHFALSVMEQLIPCVLQGAWNLS